MDAVLSSNSFAHIDDMGGVLEGVKAVLKPKGFLAFEARFALRVAACPVCALAGGMDQHGGSRVLSNVAFSAERRFLEAHGVTPFPFCHRQVQRR